MKRNIKEMLRKISKTPDPVRKDRFLREHRESVPQMPFSTWDRVRRQMMYIRVPVWILSALALMIAIGGIYTNLDTVYALSVFMPFMSGIAVFETFRSRVYGMNEMESVTPTSMRGILFSRIIGIGAVHILLLSLLAVILGSRSGYGIPMTGVILTVPYLISSTGSLELEKTAFGRKNAAWSMGFSSVVSACMIALQNHRNLFSGRCSGFWYPVVLILMAMEYRKIKEILIREDYAWN